MTTVNDIANLMEKLAPSQTAESFDNVGLLVGRKENEIKKIMITLDCDLMAVKEAIKEKCDMIVSHHPVIFSKLNRLDSDLLLLLAENKISVFSAHTSLDSCEGGVNTCLANALKLKNQERVHPEKDSLFTTNIGEISECKLSDFLVYVKDCLKIDNLRYIGNEDKIIKKVGVCGGSGGSFLEYMKSINCDAYVTADIKYHEAIYAYENDIALIDAGHFETENIVCNAIYDYLKNNLKNVEIIFSKRDKSYIKYM